MPRRTASDANDEASGVSPNGLRPSAIDLPPIPPNPSERTPHRRARALLGLGLQVQRPGSSPQEPRTGEFDRFRGGERRRRRRVKPRKASWWAGGPFRIEVAASRWRGLVIYDSCLSDISTEPSLCATLVRLQGRTARCGPTGQRAIGYQILAPRDVGRSATAASAFPKVQLLRPCGFCASRAGLRVRMSGPSGGSGASRPEGSARFGVSGAEAFVNFQMQGLRTP